MVSGDCGGRRDDRVCRSVRLLDGQRDFDEPDDGRAEWSVPVGLDGSSGVRPACLSIPHSRSDSRKALTCMHMLAGILLISAVKVGCVLSYAYTVQRSRKRRSTRKRVGTSALSK